jgi:hypothetical protein
MVRLPGSVVHRVASGVSDDVATAAKKLRFGDRVPNGVLNEMYVTRFNINKPAGSVPVQDNWLGYGKKPADYLIGPAGTGRNADTAAIRQHWDALSGPERAKELVARSPVVAGRTAATIGGVGVTGAAVAGFSVLALGYTALHVGADLILSGGERLGKLLKKPVEPVQVPR